MGMIRVVRQLVGIADPLNGADGVPYTAEVSSARRLQVDAAVTVSAVNTNAEATAANPTYAEGQNAPLSQDLSGHLRVVSEATNAALAATTGSKAAGTAAASSTLVGSVYNTTQPAPTNGQQIALQSDPVGGILVSGSLQKTIPLTGARINEVTSGDRTIVAAVASQTTRVHRLKLSVAGAVIVQVKDGAGTVLEVFNFAGNGGSVCLEFSSIPWYVTTANTAFILNLSAAVQVDGRIEYVTSV